MKIILKHIAQILYTKFNKKASKFEQNNIICELCLFLCQHHYVNSLNCRCNSFCQNRLYPRYCGCVYNKDTKCSFAAFPAFPNRQVIYIYLPLTFVQLNSTPFFCSSSFCLLTLCCKRSLQLPCRLPQRLLLPVYRRYSVQSKAA